MPKKPGGSSSTTYSSPRPVTPKAAGNRPVPVKNPHPPEEVAHRVLGESFWK